MRTNRIAAWIAACSLATIGTVASAAELMDCHIDAWKSHGAELLTPVRPTMRVEGDLKNGASLDYAKDAPILNVNIKLLRVGRSYVPSSDVVLHSSWPLNPDYRFQSGVPIKVTRVLKTPDGRKLDVITTADRSDLFIDQSGSFCNHALALHTSEVPLAGTLSIAPDGVTLERQLDPREVGAAGLRIIYEGTTAGAMHFQEVWVKGNKVIQSRDRAFDQFATSVQIAGLKFAVSNAKSDSISVSYDIPDEVVVSFGQMREIPVQSGPPQPGE
jgi:hypothetical protein